MDAIATHKIRTRYDANLTAQMRATDFRGNTYNFVAINNPDGRERELEILARS